MKEWRVLLKTTSTNTQSMRSTLRKKAHNFHKLMIEEINTSENLQVRKRSPYLKFHSIFQVIILYSSGLVPKTGPLPSNRRIWSRPSSGFERNGIFFFHSANFNTRILFPVFFGFLLYGWWGHATYGLYKQRYEDNGEIPGNMYDKLNTRVPPQSKIWLRPGWNHDKDK